MPARDRLPALPVPSLDETCARLLRALEPLLDTATLGRVRREVVDLVGGPGPELQRLLERWSRAVPTSFVHDFWEDAYLDNRAPLPIHQNAGGALSPIPAASQVGLARWTAALLSGVTAFSLRCRSGDLEPDGSPDAPWCMAQYPWLFGAARRPGIARDVMWRAEAPTHAVLARRGRYYRLEVIRADVPVPIDDVEAEVLRVLEDDGGAGEPDVGAFTSLPRAEWAVLRCELEGASPINRASLDAIDGGLALFCLDPHVSATLDDVARGFLHGAGRSRWFDKTVQLIVEDGGRFSGCLEHTRLDGLPMIRLGAESVAAASRAALEPARPPDPRRSRAEPLRWSLTPELVRSACEAAARARARYAAVESRVLLLDGFDPRAHSIGGRGTDAVLQLALQLAFRRLRGRLPSVYESAHTRHFHYGRTETLRPATVEAARFVEACVSGGPGRAGLLAEAVSAHLALTAACKDARGFDRHWLALSAMAAGLGLRVPVFSDEAIASVLTHVDVTSSAMPALPPFEMHGFGPAVPDGFGVAYQSGAGRALFNVTGAAGEATKLVGVLRAALDEIRELCATAT